MEIQIPAEPTQSEDVQSTADKEDETQDLQRVRDILFGGSLRDVLNRIESLEEDLRGQMSSAQEAAQRELEALESRLREQMDSLKRELDAEKEEHAEALENISECARKSRKEIEDRFTEITDRMNDEKVDRSSLAQMFGEISSALVSERGTARKATKPEAVPELQTDGFP